MKPFIAPVILLIVGLCIAGCTYSHAGPGLIRSVDKPDIRIPWHFPRLPCRFVFRILSYFLPQQPLPTLLPVSLMPAPK